MRNDYEYRIKTTADLSALQNLRREMEAQKKVVDQNSAAARILEAEMTKVNAALESQRAKALASAQALEKTAHRMGAAGGNVGAVLAERNNVLAAAGLSKPGTFRDAAGAFGTSFMEAGGGIAGIGAGARAGAAVYGAGAVAAVAASAAGIGAAAKAMHEYASAEERVAKLSAALAQRGQLSDPYLEYLQELAASLGKVTAIASGDWVAVLTRLTQFGANTSNIKQNADAVKNLAGVLGGDLQTAAMMVGKALQGEFTAFSRLGIEFDKNASQTENLNRLYEELAVRGGGQLEASANTINGQFRQLRNNSSDLWEAFGRGISQTGLLQATIYGLSTSIGWLASKLGGTISKAGDFKNATRDISAEMREAEARTKSYGDQIDRLKKSMEASARAQESIANQISSQTRDSIELKTAETDAAIAKVDSDVASGKISKEDGDRRKANLKAGLITFTHDAEQSDRQRRISLNEGLEADNDRRFREVADLARAEEARLQNSEKVKPQRDDLFSELTRKVARAKLDLDTFNRYWGDIADKGDPAKNPLGHDGPGDGKRFFNIRKTLEANLNEVESERTGKLYEFDASTGFVDPIRQKQVVADAMKARGEAQALTSAENMKLQAEREQLERRLSHSNRLFPAQARSRLYESVAERGGDISAPMEGFLKGLEKTGDDVSKLIPILQHAGRRLAALQRKGEKVERDIEDLKRFYQSLDSSRRNR